MNGKSKERLLKRLSIALFQLQNALPPTSAQLAPTLLQQPFQTHKYDRYFCFISILSLSICILSVIIGYTINVGLPANSPLPPNRHS
jgi:hypothetical protein